MWLASTEVRGSIARFLSCASQNQRQHRRGDCSKEYSDEHDRLDQQIETTIATKTARILAHHVISILVVWNFSMTPEPVSPDDYD